MIRTFRRGARRAHPSRAVRGTRSATRPAAATLTLSLLLACALVLSSAPATAGPSTTPAGAGSSRAPAALPAADLPTGACAGAQLAPAPLGQDPDIAPDGSPVRISASRDGDFVPVLMVHGWTGRSTHRPARDGAFSSRIDLTANRMGGPRVPRSLIGQLQGVPGTAVYTFDYHQFSGRWVTDAKVGGDLGVAIDCLYQRHGQQVIIVGHSMGGLAARHALAGTSRTGGPRTEAVSRVVTFGTPHTGSLLAAVAAGALDGAAVNGALSGNHTAAVIRLLLAACGRATTEAIKSGSWCDGLAKYAAAFAAFDGDAGRALRAGSPQLRDLAHPKVPFHALGGDIEFAVSRRAGWFNLGWATTTVAAGDMVVMPDSATHRSADSRMLRCRYQLNPQAVMQDQVLMFARLKARQDADPLPLSLAAGSSPCFHGGLMRSIELTNDALAIVADDVASRASTLPSDLLSAPVPSLCQLEPGQLIDGYLDRSSSDRPGAAVSLDLTDGQVTPDKVLLGDLDGRGGQDAAIAVYCSWGGVSHPQTIQFYTGSTPTRLGGVSLGDISGGDRDNIHEMTLEDGTVKVKWMSLRDGDFGCCATDSLSAELRFDGQQVVASNVVRYPEDDHAQAWLESVLAGDLLTAEAAAAPGIVDQVRFGPQITDTSPTCYGQVLTGDWPQDVLDAYEGTGVADALSSGEYGYRFCMFETESGIPAILGMYPDGWDRWTIRSYMHTGP